MNEKYIIVDKGMCTACGACMGWAPDVFTYDEMSLGENLIDHNTGTIPIPNLYEEEVSSAVSFCPTAAIKVSHKPFVDWVPTSEFGTESPNNPNVDYELKTEEITIDEITGKNIHVCSCGTGHKENDTTCSCHTHADPT